MMKHGTYDDFWKSPEHSPARQATSSRHCMTVGGWFDAENLFGALETFKAAEANATGVPKGGNTLVMGPWVHGGWNRGDGRQARRRDVRREHRRPLPHADRVAVLRVPPEGQGRSWKHGRRRGSSRPARTSWRKFDAWPPKPSAKPTDYTFDRLRSTRRPELRQRRSHVPSWRERVRSPTPRSRCRSSTKIVRSACSRST